MRKRTGGDDEFRQISRTVVPQLQQPTFHAPHPDGMRTVVDAEGREWRVYERSAGELSPTAGRVSLIFDTDGIVRRLWAYPSSWAVLRDADLLGLMDGVRATATSG